MVLLEDVGGTVKLPALDGSQLTNIAPSAIPLTTTSASPAGSYTISLSGSVANAIFLLSPTVASTVTLPAASSYAGSQVRVKLLTDFALTISAAGGTIDGSSSFVQNQQYAALSFVSDGSNWFIY